MCFTVCNIDRLCLQCFCRNLGYISVIMLSLVLAWIALCIAFVGGFLDLDELKNVYYGIDISDTPLLHPSVCYIGNRCGLCI